MEIAPHLALWLGVCLTVVVYSLNEFGDVVRDVLAPRLRGRLGRYGAGREPRLPAPRRGCIPQYGSGVQTVFGATARSRQSSERGFWRRFITAVTIIASP